MLEIIILLIFLSFYFLPSFIAYNRENKNVLAITVLNLLTGWTLIGWVLALVWALKNE